MPGEKVTTSTQYRRQETESGKATAAISEQRRGANFNLATLTLVIGAIVASSFYALVYVQTRAWQLLAEVGFIAVALVSAAVAYGLARRGRLDTAGCWIVFGVTAAYGGGELLLANATLYFTVGGILLIVLAGGIILPRKWVAWLVMAGLFGAYAWLINRFEPLPRYDVTQSTLLRSVTLGVTSLVALAILWHIVRTFRIGTIRTRLLVTFVAMVLLLAVAIGAASATVSWRNGQRQVVNQLESVAALKEAEIETWVNSLQTDLIAVLLGEDAILHARVLLQESPAPSGYLGYQLRSRFQQAVEQVGRFEELFLLDRQGLVILSTDSTQEGKIQKDMAYFKEGLTRVYTTPPYYSLSLGRITVVTARPVTDDQGQVVGVLAGRASMATLNEIMGERAGLGETGETYLVGHNHALLTATRSGERDVYVRTPGANAAITRQVNGSALYSNYRGQPVVGVYHWLPELQVVLLAEQEQAEAFRGIYAMLATNFGVALAAVLLAAVASLFITRSIANPLASLAETATQIASGDLMLAAKVEREDEVGTLAQAFNRMTAQLRDLIGSLEQRVAERTRDLEQRSSYLEASAQVSRAATSILETEQLIRQVVELIRERFGLYYVGLFLVDETGEWAVLRAGTGEAGRVMLARGHRIEVGEGMVGWSIAHAQARVALEAGEDAVRLATSELPDTRSEAALPLRSRGQVLGALTVQSDQPGAFNQDTIVVLQTMADQVAVALDNARLFVASQEALETERRAYGEISREVWAQMLRARADWGYRCDQRGIFSSEGDRQPEMEQATRNERVVLASNGAAVAMPVRIRDHVVGALNFRKGDDGDTWTDEEIALLKTLAEQLGLALESAQLYQNTQRRAVHERLTSEVTSRMRETLDVDTVLQTAVREIGEALDLAQVQVRMRSGVTSETTEV